MFAANAARNRLTLSELLVTVPLPAPVAPPALNVWPVEGIRLPPPSTSTRTLSSGLALAAIR